MEEKIFMLADGSYCSFEDARMIVIESKTPKSIPEEKEPSKFLPVTLLTVAITILAFFITQFIRTGMHVFTVLFIMPAIFLVYLLSERINYGFSRNIPLNKIKSLGVFTKKMGFDFIILVYEDKNGKLRRRKLKLYDSRENTDRAKRVLASVGLYNLN